jgi:hypothetical protein
MLETLHWQHLRWQNMTISTADEEPIPGNCGKDGLA